MLVMMQTTSELHINVDCFNIMSFDRLKITSRHSRRTRTIKPKRIFHITTLIPTPLHRPNFYIKTQHRDILTRRGSTTLITGNGVLLHRTDYILDEQILDLK